MKSSKPSTSPKSPCVRNCCLNQQDVCLGCFRHIDEITGWNSFSDQEKENTLSISGARKKEYLDKHPLFK
ncbi:MAG: DUF1289 domain-containing protein [Moraxellaceae bacterium]|nr:MAG: DUF1289 domain-containing protein [Moraxellaceae bacterium]